MIPALASCELCGLLGRLVDGCIKHEPGLGHDRRTACDNEASLIGRGRIDRLDQDGNRGFRAFVTHYLGGG
jgi:hypothetical protein